MPGAARCPAAITCRRKPRRTRCDGCYSTSRDGCGKLSKRRARCSLWEGTMKQYPVWLSALFLLGACSSGSSQSAMLILNNPTWDRVNVEAVITNNAEFGKRGQGDVPTQNLGMTKGHPVRGEAPHSESVWSRHGRKPNQSATHD